MTYNVKNTQKIQKIKIFYLDSHVIDTHFQLRKTV